MTPRMFGKTLCTAIATFAVVMAVSFAPLSAGKAPAADPCSAPATTILVVRHADRAGDADSLSAAGRERARELGRVAAAANVTAIYHSDTRRTRDTAAPLAQALHITPEEYPAKEVDALVRRILHDHSGGTVLVVGHSNTLASIIKAAGGPDIAPIDEHEFDGLYLLHVPRCGPVKLTQLEYGKPSP